MSSIRQSIDVAVPLSTAYGQWTQFEEYPVFMQSVDRVVQVDDATMEWSATIDGRTVRWRARIVEQVPDERIAWVSLEGARNDGVVTFQPIGPDRTRVHVRIDVDPEGPVEHIGDAAGVVQGRVRGDLERFRDFVERRGESTGAWRGEVPHRTPDRYARSPFAAEPDPADQHAGPVRTGATAGVDQRTNVEAPQGRQTAEGSFATGMEAEPGPEDDAEGSFATGMEAEPGPEDDAAGSFATGMEAEPGPEDDAAGSFATGEAAHEPRRPEAD